ISSYLGKGFETWSIRAIFSQTNCSIGKHHSLYQLLSRLSILHYAGHFLNCYLYGLDRCYKIFSQTVIFKVLFF
ncbi:hypothetical protein L9F63_001768, partial [Diploptera punctata]